MGMKRLAPLLLIAAAPWLTGCGAGGCGEPESSGSAPQEAPAAASSGRKGGGGAASIYDTPKPAQGGRKGPAPVEELSVATWAPRLAKGISLVMVYGPNCPPCEQAAPVMAHLKESEPKANYYTLDLEPAENQAVLPKGEWSPLPVFLLYADGKLAGSRRGLPVSPKPGEAPVVFEARLGAWLLKAVRTRSLN